LSGGSLAGSPTTIGANSSIFCAAGSVASLAILAGDRGGEVLRSLPFPTISLSCFS